MVTGAGGFIGQAFLASLGGRAYGWRALVGPPGFTPARPLPAGLEVQHAEITDGATLRRLAQGMEAVVHLAGPSSVAASFLDPLAFASAHLLGTTVVLEACRAAGVRRFVHVSSAEVYGATTAAAVAETHPLRPRSPYGVAKVGGEAMVAALAPTMGLEAVVLRPFSVYGPGGRPDAVLPTVLRQALHSSVVEVVDPRPVRDFVHVDDVVEVLRLALTTALPPGAVVTCNVGTGVGTSIGELATTALRVTGRSSEVVAAPSADRPSGSDISRLVADTSLAREVLGWHAAVGLDDGLRRMIAEGSV